MKTMILVATMLVCFAAANNALAEIIIYDTQAEIIQHQGDNVSVGVSISLGNQGPTSNVHAIVRALDSSGYEMAHATVRGKLPGGRNDSLKGRLHMRRMEYLRVDRWEVYDLVSYPAP